VEALGRASGEAAAAPGPRERGALVLVGFMGAGKSTTARMLAAELGVESIDSDRELERELGEPIDSFYDRQGEQAFRAREEEVVLRLLSDDHERVVALGGGSLGSERVREALGRHLVVHLEVEPDEAWRRASNRASAGDSPWRSKFSCNKARCSASSSASSGIGIERMDEWHAEQRAG